ncbi:MAG TPA: TetR/AcrR family transcriptional regulator [Caldilineaceae bacterium]|nr:TetR/AcrR family transcriptional regulator [Caldilineaceae bacterium]
MPTETFFNLPSEKRQLITEIAIEEFADNEYSDVSISRIVARAGIAKGSFYQYFADKEDLHGYLLDLIAEKKRAHFSLEHPDPNHIGVFRYLRWMAQAGVQFELLHPQLTRVGYRALNRHANPQGIFARYRHEALTFYRRLVATGKAQGDIAPEIDEELAAFFFEAIFSMLGQFLAAHIATDKTTDKEVWQERHAIFERPEVIRFFDQTIDMLEQGLGAHRALCSQGRNETQQVYKEEGAP